MYSYRQAAAAFVTTNVWGNAPTSPENTHSASDGNTASPHITEPEMRQLPGERRLATRPDTRSRAGQRAGEPHTPGRRSQSIGPGSSPGRPGTPGDGPAEDSGSGTSWLHDDPRRLAAVLARETRLANERDDLLTEVAELKEQVGQLNDQVAQLNEHARKDGQLIDDYKTANDKLDRSCKALEAANDRLDRTCKSFKAANDLFVTRCKEHLAANADLDQQYKHLKAAAQVTARKLVYADEDAAFRQQELDQLRPLVKQVEQLKHDVARLPRVEDTLKKLQQEVLAGVDRHQPAFDEAVLGAFVTVNGKINALVKYTGAFFKKVGAVPFEEWADGAVWPGAYNVEVEALRPEVRDRRLVKQLLRLVVWKFLGRTLLDRARPFACFGSKLARHLDDDYHVMFRDLETTEAAAKWRSMTAARLLELDDEPCRASTEDFLILEFATAMHKHMGHAATPVEELHDWVKGSVLKQLGPVLKAAVALARLVAKERSGFSLEMPDLAAVGFAKGESDAQMTTLGADLNIDVGGANEDEGGVVVLVASPMLIKWGASSGHGQAGSRDVLAKAFVEVVPGTQLPPR